MIKVFGSVNNKNIHSDTSNTLLGAKQYDTRNGLKNVSVRVGYNVTILECKVFNRWFKFCNKTNKILITK